MTLNDIFEIFRFVTDYELEQIVLRIAALSAAYEPTAKVTESTNKYIYSFISANKYAQLNSNYQQFMIYPCSICLYSKLSVGQCLVT